VAAEKLAEYHGAPATSHSVSLGGTRTNGRSILVFAFVTGENLRSAVPSVWKTSHSIELATVDARWFRMLPEDNDGSVSSLEVTFDQARAFSAVIFEDDLDDAVFYADCRNTGPTGSDPALWGTRLHTFPLVEESFAAFIGWGATTGPVTLDLTAYDQGYTDFADSGSTTSPISGDFPSRVWLGRGVNKSMANDGVTATASDDAAAGNVVDGISGMIAYAVLTANPPINMTAPTLAGIPETGETLACLRGTWRNGPDSYSFQWQRSSDAGSSWPNISGATASAYTLEEADLGALVRCRVTSTNDFGDTVLNTSSVLVAAPALVGDIFVKKAGVGWVPTVSQVKVAGDWVGADA
jgi:hypothetical protein